jgi:hypothetical protein
LREAAARDGGREDMMKIKIVTIMLAAGLATGAAAQDRETHRTTLPDGTVCSTRITRWDSGRSYGSTKCRAPKRKTFKIHPDNLPVIEIDPEARRLWDIAYTYMKKARKGKTTIRGEMGEMKILENSVVLGGSDVEIDKRVEQAIWLVVQLEGASDRPLSSPRSDWQTQTSKQ